MRIVISHLYLIFKSVMTMLYVTSAKPHHQVAEQLVLNVVTGMALRRTRIKPVTVRLDTSKAYLAQQVPNKGSLHNLYIKPNLFKQA